MASLSELYYYISKIVDLVVKSLIKIRIWPLGIRRSLMLGSKSQSHQLLGWWLVGWSLLACRVVLVVGREWWWFVPRRCHLSEVRSIL